MDLPALSEMIILGVTHISLAGIIRTNSLEGFGNKVNAE
jgi:hypothetical protein